MWSVLLALPLALAPADDAFLAGYATAIVEREFQLEDATVDVQDGEVHVRARRVPGDEAEKLRLILEAVPGVASVDVVEGPRPGVAAVGPASRLELLPEREIFDPLLADPRWPHFAASAQLYASDEELTRVAAVSFGEAIPLLGFDAPLGGRGELALHASVFSIFDLEADSFDLVNSDFLVGLAFAWRRDAVSMLVRLLHQSSHLGDEFLLRDRTDDRINLSYEELDLLVSWEPFDFLRLYGGGGVLLRRDPSDLERPMAQGGLELVSPTAYLGGAARPLLAVDVQGREESGWEPAVSVRAGVQLESPRLLSQRVQLLLEYYNGNSPNGQFFAREIEYWGLGMHLHY